MSNEIYSVEMTARAIKDLRKVPLYIALKLQAWVDDIGQHGLLVVRKIPGYHDEPLKGKRLGQRSIYIIDEDNKVKFVEVLEVNKHEY